MKFYVYFIAILNLNVFSQEKYLTKTGSVNFEASVSSFEEVAAKNNSVTAILNSQNGEFAALVLVNAFRFKNALMEEHFNENYSESSIYPKATFKGIIQNFSIINLEKKSVFKIIGELTFHGKTKKLEPITLICLIENGTLKITGDFVVKASDFDIKIPKIVSNKIANNVKVSFQFELKNNY